MGDKVYFQGDAGIEMWYVRFTKSPDCPWHEALAADNEQFPPYIYNDYNGMAPITAGGYHGRVLVWGGADILMITRINGIETKFREVYHNYGSLRCAGYEALLDDARIAEMVKK